MLITSLIGYESAVNDSINTLLRTRPGEVLANPAYGTNFDTLKNQALDNSYKEKLKALVADAISLFEHRILITSIEVVFADILNGLIEINLHYTYIAKNTRHNYVFPFYSFSGEPLEILTSINQSLRDLLSTKPGDRASDPEYGIDLDPLLLTGIYNEQTSTALLGEVIANAIRRYETRIDLYSVSFDVEQMYSGVIYVSMAYYQKIETNGLGYLQLSCPYYISEI